METQISNQSGTARIALAGRFDFTAHRDFKQCYENSLGATDVRELEIDLGSVEYLDSSALGMLLILKEKAGAVNKRVSLTNCKGSVRQVLDIANFAKVFPIR